MKHHTNIVLVGPMGSGKTAVGKQLARELDLDFVDSDAEIENRTGVDVSYIFEKEGEQGFRTREREVIAELTGRDAIVLATGGGAVLDSDSRQLLAECGTVVYLRTTIEQQLERTRHTRHRPLLLGRDPETVLIELMQTREPLYEDVAEFTVNTGGRRVSAVVAEVRKALGHSDSTPLKK